MLRRRARLAVALSLLCGSSAWWGCNGAPPRLRLVALISVDTLRADRLGVYGGTLGLTPHLDSLAQQSVVFDAYAPTSFTLPSVGSLLTGRYPEEIGIPSNRSALGSSVPTLATTLRDAGWKTGAVVSNFVLRANAGLGVGFDRYDDELPAREVVRAWPERLAADTTDAALEMVGALAPGPDSAPLFLWVHYQDPHGPYTPPPGRRERYLEAERGAPDGLERLPQRTGRGGHGHLPSYQEVDGRREVAFYRAGYDGEIAYLDEEIGRLLRGLAERFPHEATVVAFTADHGESLGEDDYWFAHGDRLSDPLVRVPLLIRTPDAKPSTRDDVAALVDVFPTLAALAGVEAPETRGRHLLGRRASEIASRPYLATLGTAVPGAFGIVEGRHKLVVTGGAGPTATLFRRDPGGGEVEIRNPELLARLREDLRSFRRALPHAPVEQRQHLSDSDRARLRALGYAEEARSPE